MERDEIDELSKAIHMALSLHRSMAEGGEPPSVSSAEALNVARDSIDRLATLARTAQRQATAAEGLRKAVHKSLCRICRTKLEGKGSVTCGLEPCRSALRALAAYDAAMKETK